MALQREAMSREDFERADKGLPPIKKKKIVRPEPERPEIKNELSAKDIKSEDFIDLMSAKRNVIKNGEGIRFIGFDVVIKVVAKGPGGRPAQSKDGKPVPPKIVNGWMDEGNFLELRRTFLDIIKPQVIHW